MFKKTVLKNGLRIITVPQKNGLSATVLVLVEAGSKYETKDINGISHFLEHMCFKGTTRRPTDFHISSELDQLGAEYNAFTGQEYTGYYAKVKSSYLDKAIDIVSDLYSNPLFNENDFEKEKGVIIEEINMYEDLPQRKIADSFTELLYGDQPAGWNIAGTKDTIRRMKRDQLVAYRKQHYVASASTIVVAGSFNEKKVLAHIEKAFATIPADKKFGKNKTKESQQKPQVSLEYRTTDQTHIIVGCRAFDMFDDRRYALTLLSTIIGGGMSSRLFQIVRGQLGAAYYIRSGTDFSTDHGFWTTSSGVDHKKLTEVIKAILGEMKKLTREKVNDEELQRVKDNLSGSMAIGLESSDDLATYYGFQELLRKSLQEPDVAMKKYEAVTADDIQKVARYIFQDKKLNLAIIGPYKDKKIFEKILTLR